MKRRRIASNKRVLVLCEGVTEEVYAKALRTAFLPRHVQRTVTIDVVRHKKNDPLNLIAEAIDRVKSAKKERIPYDYVWLFFDDDNSPHLPEVMDRVEKHGFNLAFTSICIENWFILHLEECGRAFANGEECEKYLKRSWPNFHKTKVNHFTELREHLETAIHHAKRLEIRNEGISILQAKPYTSVHKLVDFFNKLGEAV